MDLVEKHCERYLTSLINCTEKYPVTWKHDCRKEKLKLSMCSSRIPEVNVVQVSCGKEYQVYSDCVNKHSSHAQVCSELLHQLKECQQRHIEKNSSSQQIGKDTAKDFGKNGMS